MADCYQENCPWRIKDYSSPHSCQCVAFPNRYDGTTCYATDNAEGYRLGKEDAEAGGKDNNVPTNEPLTIERLREMDGQPVWDENGKCYLVDTTYRFCSCSDIEIAIVDKHGDVRRHPERRTLYCRPPEGEGNA